MTGIDIKKARGLSEDEVRQSRAEHGVNVMSVAKKKSFWSHFISNLNDPIIKILIGALIINVLFVFRTSDWMETAGIALSVFLATFISTMSEYGSQNAFAKLNEANENYLCRVRRDGDLKEIPVSEIVCGDVVLLSSGDCVPADGFIIEGALTVDQSAMTGESIEVEKKPRNGEALSPKSSSALLRGCCVMSGNGIMLVSAVGDKTLLGEISRELQLDTRESPMKIRLSKLAKQISRMGYAAAVLIGLVYLFNELVLDSGSNPAVILMKLSNWRYMIETALNALTLGLTVVIVAVPEGLYQYN